ncbi:MAG TPA: ABC transporter ATP-binding protein [Gemmatimonadales bacterium]|nr:ABC transporter ATP-binding protein [Gemmatimonadales bacterium]
MASVTLRHLGKRFDSTGNPVLHDLSLEVRDGEFLVLLGPSGCGKTTVLRCVAGLEEPSTGEILIGTRDVTHLSPADRDVAMVFQNYALYPHLSVRANLAFPLEMRRLATPEIARRVADTAARLGLSELLERRPGQLSGGQRQRVALGRAIVREPQAFLFDEPLSNLDAQLRAEMRAEVLKLHRSLGATMLYVTHDQVEAMTMGERVAVLHEGRLRQIGTPAEVYERPANTFVARFIGSPGMNVIAGKGEMGDGVGVISSGSLRVTVDALHYSGELQIGVRPEHVGIGARGRAAGNAVVRLVEPLGSETLVHLEAGDRSLVARVPGIAAFEVGAEVGVKLDPQRLHFFDAAGERIG